MREPKEAGTAGHAKDIVSAFPQFLGLEVVLLGEGYDFRVFEVGQHWLFRFPKREGSVDKLNTEERLLSELGKALPLPIPTYEYFGHSKEGPGWPFAGYKKLPGIPGDQSNDADPALIARQLGHFLDRLHAYPTDRAREAGVANRYDLVAHWRSKALEELDRVVEFDKDLLGIGTYLSHDVPLAFDGAATLVHNDLMAEHVLVSPRSGGVSGVIDWGDVVIGDPAVDFAGLYAWFGKHSVEHALADYTGRLGSEGIKRARFLATCLAIHAIALGQELPYDRWVDEGRKALRLIFEC